MADALVKPTAAALEDPEQLLRIIMRLYDAVTEIQTGAARASVMFIVARSVDPGVPPVGKVYVYSWQGALYARTATAPTLLAA